MKLITKFLITKSDSLLSDRNPLLPNPFFPNIIRYYQIRSLITQSILAQDNPLLPNPLNPDPENRDPSSRWPPAWCRSGFRERPCWAAADPRFPRSTDRSDLQFFPKTELKYSYMGWKSRGEGARCFFLQNALFKFFNAFLLTSFLGNFLRVLCFTPRMVGWWSLFFAFISDQTSQIFSASKVRLGFLS